MIEKIIFISEMSFTLRDYDRLGIKLLENKGFQVEIFDLSYILCHGSVEIKNDDKVDHEGLTVFKKKKEVIKRIKSLTNRDFVINLIGFLNGYSTYIYNALSFSKAKYAVFCASSLPSLNGHNPKVNTPYNYKSMIKIILTYRFKNFWKLIMFIRQGRIRPPCLLLTCGNRNDSSCACADESTEVLSIHALDYDLYLKEKQEPVQEDLFAVFLDQFVPFFTDFGEVPRIHPESYYESLNRLFNYIENHSSLKVIIAAHPRSYYETLPDYFNGRKIVKGETVKLVKNCKLVLAHSSTALNFANLFYKPVTFLNFSEFSGSNLGRLIQEFAKWFGKQAINIDRDYTFDFEKELLVSQNHYKEYKWAFIKTDVSEELPFWEIVANRIKQYF
jgi:hypothetical protein